MIRLSSKEEKITKGIIIFLAALMLPIANYAVTKFLDVFFAGLGNQVSFSPLEWTVLAMAFGFYALIIGFVTYLITDVTSKQCTCTNHVSEKRKEQ